MNEPKLFSSTAASLHHPEMEPQSLSVEVFEDVIKRLKENYPVEYHPSPIHVLPPPKTEGERVVSYGVEFETVRDESGTLVWNMGELTEEAKEILRLLFYD